MAYEFTPEEELILAQLEIHEDSRVWPVTLPEKYKFGQTEIRGLATLLRSLAENSGGAVTRYTRGSVGGENLYDTDVITESVDLVIAELPTQHVYMVQCHLIFGPVGGSLPVKFGIYGTGAFEDCSLVGWGEYRNRNTFPYAVNSFSFDTTNNPTEIDLGDGSSEFVIDYRGVLVPYSPGPAPETARLSVYWGPSIADPTVQWLRPGSTFSVDRLPNEFLE